MLDLKTVITTKNLEYYMIHQEVEVIEMLKSIMMDVKLRSENRTLNEQNFKMLKPETIKVSFSFIKSILSKYGYKVGHRIDGCIERAPETLHISTEAPNAGSGKKMRIDLDKLKQYQGDQKLLSLRINTNIWDRWDQMAKSNPGIQKSYLLSYVLDEILAQFGH